MRSLMSATEDEMTAAFADERAANQCAVGDTQLPENVRLILQCATDNGADVIYGFPMWLEGVPDEAVRLGLMEQVLPVGGAGYIGWRVTQSGSRALAAANSALGAKATRYINNVKEFGGSLKPVVYGYPFLAPLTQPVEKVDGCLVAKRAKRSLLSWFFG